MRNEGNDENDTNDKTTTTASSEVDCGNNFNAAVCNITLAGKLLIVLDGNKDGMIMKNNGLKCFCELVYSNLNATNVTAEVLTGSNEATNCSSIDKERVNKTLLQERLNFLNSIYNPKVGEEGMALIVSDSSNPSDLFNNFPDEKEEPFIYFVSVGKQKNTSIEDSCHRQYRFINDMSEISTIGSELMENACNPRAYMENNCASTTAIESTISTPSQQATVQMPIVVVGVLGALILAVVIVLCLIFTPKCRRNGKSKEETSVEFTAVDNRVGGISELLYAEGRTFQSNLSRDWQNICSEEQTKKNKENAENCNYLHMKFREDKIDPSIYERMTAKEDSGHTIKAIATN
ncbi:uncharacterized protein LOC134236143 [Saccostrea cucullata]|uniref:uncharacterized protein LOC134236143 n=1 Tax=Saccostrea cuccullata TaxID=36930 RepID=UPI002ED548F7